MRGGIGIGIAVLAAASLAGAASAQDVFGAGLKGKKLERAIKAAESFPLGARRNPVRVKMPVGERAYLTRLRCADGSAPRFGRSGNGGSGVFGNIVDIYQVECAGQPAATVWMDMYHDHVETRAVPGFTIVAPAE